MRRLLLVLLLASPAFADTTPKREGDYGGVVPGQKPEGKPKRAAKGTLSWIGFEAKDGGAQLFFQSAAPFEVTQKVVGNKLLVTLSLRKLASNTWRRIDTRFFDNPLAGADAKLNRKKRAVDVVITFKNPKDAREGTLRTATEADGLFYAYLSFPEGTRAEPPPAADDQPD